MSKKIPHLEDIIQSRLETMGQKLFAYLGAADKPFITHNVDGEDPEWANPVPQLRRDFMLSAINAYTPHMPRRYADDNDAIMAGASVVVLSDIGQKLLRVDSPSLHKREYFAMLVEIAKTTTAQDLPRSNSAVSLCYAQLLRTCAHPGLNKNFDQDGGAITPYLDNLKQVWDLSATFSGNQKAMKAALVATIREMDANPLSWADGNNRSEINYMLKLGL